jgi:hypothetical protein
MLWPPGRTSLKIAFTCCGRALGYLMTDSLHRKVRAGSAGCRLDTKSNRMRGQKLNIAPWQSSGRKSRSMRMFLCRTWGSDSSVFWDVTLCGLVQVYLYPNFPVLWRQRQQVPPKFKTSYHTPRRHISEANILQRVSYLVVRVSVCHLVNWLIIKRRRVNYF